MVEQSCGDRERKAREFALEVVRRLRQAGFEAYWAGGCVRDRLLGLTPHDYDVATNALPEQVQNLFRRTVAVGASFGVVEVIGPRVDGETIRVQVATFRTEGPYSDSRHPDFVTFTDAAHDAQRRDFTVNGLFYDPLTGQVLDFVGGQRDLQARLLRAIGDPAQRFAEDKLRMIRAVRLAAHFNLTIESATANAIREMADQVSCVSAERVAEELRRLLTSPGRVRGMELLRQLKLLRPILPELAELPDDVHAHACEVGPRASEAGATGGQVPFAEPGCSACQDNITRQATDTTSEPVAPSAASSVRGSSLWEHTLCVLGLLRQPSFPLALAALFHDAGKARGDADQQTSNAAEAGGEIAPESSVPARHAFIGAKLVEQAGRRLRLANAEWLRAAWLVAHHHDLDSPWSLPRHILKPLLAHEAITELLELVRANLLAQNRSLDPVEFCVNKLREWPRDVLDPPPLVSGEDLIALGLKPGPIFRDILQQVRNAQLDEIITTRDEAIAFVRRIIGDQR